MTGLSEPSRIRPLSALLPNRPALGEGDAPWQTFPIPSLRVLTIFVVDLNVTVVRDVCTASVPSLRDSTTTKREEIGI